MLLPPHLRCKQHSFRVIGGEPDFGALVFPLRQIALAHCGVKSIHDPRCPLIPRRKLRHFRLGQRFRSTTRAPGELGHYARALALEDARPSFAAHVGGVHMKSRNRERSSMLQWANRRIGPGRRYCPQPAYRCPPFRWRGALISRSVRQWLICSTLKRQSKPTLKAGSSYRFTGRKVVERLTRR
jgi:hypothetical protein